MVGAFVIFLSQFDGDQRGGAHADQRAEGGGEVHQREGQCQAGDGECADSVTDENAVCHVVQRGGCHGDNGGNGVLRQQLADAFRAQYQR